MQPWERKQSSDYEKQWLQYLTAVTPYYAAIGLVLKHLGDPASLRSTRQFGLRKIPFEIMAPAVGSVCVMSLCRGIPSMIDCVGCLCLTTHFSGSRLSTAEPRDCHANSGSLP